MVSRCLYENNYQDIDPSFVANEIAVITKYVRHFTPEQLGDLTTIVSQINWQTVTDQKQFHQELESLRTNLGGYSPAIKKRSFNLLGHAHLDMAWLWTIDETYDVAQRTFKSVLNLQNNHQPNLTFGHTTAYLYQWIEEHNPELFAQIKKAIAQGKWEVLGGMWVEPEVNLISGESLVRQLLYGQKYCKEKFGAYNRVAWLPDTFGFPWQLPQILTQAGIEYFVTGKLHWNDTNKFPHGCFWWQSPDGSKIFTAMSPPNVAGVMDTNPEVMSDYSVSWEEQTGLQDSFWLPGVGDHGGGPTRDMLDVAQRYQNSPFFPQINFVTASEYLDHISSNKEVEFPVWNDELYLELHRGCYTTHADQKYFNRYCENLLYQAELFATLNYVLADQHNPEILEEKYQQDQIKSLWEKVLLNQFHDILPGTSITPVFTQSNQLWREVINDGELLLRNSLRDIGDYIQHPKFDDPQIIKAIVIFNSLNWDRSQLVELELELPENYEIIDEQERLLPTQISHDRKLLFLAAETPGIGYKSYYLRLKNNSFNNLSQSEQEIEKYKQNLKITGNNRQNNYVKRQKALNSLFEEYYSAQNLTKKTEQLEEDPQLENFILQNEYLTVEISLSNGNLVRVFDRQNKKEILKERQEGNQLQLFKDQGQYWDAWNIDPNYQQHPLPEPKLTSISLLETGTLRQIIRVIKTYNQSTFIQDYILETHENILKITNYVDWQEDYTLLKVKFPFNITSDYVTNDIAFGHITHPTNPQTPYEKAKWELYNHKWIDLSDDRHGISLLNDGKYGYDIKRNEIQLSLLRSPKWPDPQSDRERHQFTYALYPHNSNWQKARLIQRSNELNISLQILIQELFQSNISSLSSIQKMIQLKNNNLIITAFKVKEENKKQIIIRGYESEKKIDSI